MTVWNYVAKAKNWMVSGMQVAVVKEEMSVDVFQWPKYFSKIIVRCIKQDSLWKEILVEQISAHEQNWTFLQQFHLFIVLYAKYHSHRRPVAHLINLINQGLLASSLSVMDSPSETPSQQFTSKFLKKGLFHEAFSNPIWRPLKHTHPLPHKPEKTVANIH